MRIAARRFSGITRLAALYLLSASLWGGEALEADSYRIPLTQTDGMTYSLPVVLEGIGEVAMLLDTGAAYSTLTVELVEKLVSQGKAFKTGQKQARLANGEYCPLYIYQLNELNLGGCVLRNITVAATDQTSRNLIGIETLKHAEPISIQLSPPVLSFERCGGASNAGTQAETTHVR